MTEQQQPPLKAASGGRARIPYDGWADDTKLPIYGGNSIGDPMALELAPWSLFGMDTAFLQLEGMPTVCEGRVSEIPSNGKSDEIKQAVGEIVYVLGGQGTTTVWAEGREKKTISWRRSSLFVLPRNNWFQLTNTGSEPVRLLSYNFRPLAMTSIPDFNLHFRGPIDEPNLLYGGSDDFYAAPRKVASDGNASLGQNVTWHGNYFEDMSAWDELVASPAHGAGRIVNIEFPGAEMNCHMAVIDPQVYKKAHKHGPGRVIVLVKGEGHATLTKLIRPEEEEELVQIPLREGGFFATPDNWYHQHFNTSDAEARFLTLHPLPQFAGNPYRHQIEYTDEDPRIRKMFEDALSRKGLASKMPAQAYTDASWQWVAGGAG